MVIVEDPSSIFTVQWLTGPYGNVHTLQTYASYIKSQYPEQSDRIPQPWPIGLNTGSDNRISSDITSTVSSSNRDLANSVVVDAETVQASNSFVEAQISSSPPGGSPYEWFGSVIEASVMCSIDVDDQAVTSCGCEMFQFTKKPCGHMFTVSKELGLPIVFNRNPTVSVENTAMPIITCKLHCGRKLVTECNCDHFQNLSKPCSHMRKMCRTLGLELYVLTSDSDNGSDASSSIDSEQHIKRSEEDHSLPQSVDPNALEQVSKTISHSDFTTPLVRSTCATLKRITNSLSKNAINRLITSVDPETVEAIEGSVKRLERSFGDALDSGRPSKQHRHAQSDSLLTATVGQRRKARWVQVGSIRTSLSASKYALPWMHTVTCRCTSASCDPRKLGIEVEGLFVFHLRVNQVESLPDWVRSSKGGHLWTETQGVVCLSD
ncbi:uncharacterized protein MELLADRAFT_84854 [Melampsora larici-populina 98AG31]|uniref:SWIM-type domain-containing protein n=1 Tax=Melampsora larici-populina (strain 98AG31 / pathotype 3-4-7) TaxID=747676 RepID=F4SCQ3_MELLP|nr:uncharacterized protein MELLADRAFT_84854 [Melampsora larici-populina 98AG31]EGF97576.1 hypothetical protein MELLADRAFT_84854 [Melampsora larici-populina 98AG31]